MIFYFQLNLKLYMVMLKKLTIYVKLKAFNYKVNFVKKYDS